MRVAPRGFGHLDQIRQLFITVRRGQWFLERLGYHRLFYMNWKVPQFFNVASSDFGTLGKH